MTAKTDVLKAVEEYVRAAVQQHDSGHGWSHIERVVRLALHVHDTEGKGDRFIIELGALLHDIGDHKFALHDGPAEIRALLVLHNVEPDIIEKVVTINENISFSKARNDLPKDDELQIVQDADRLDAMGAIGIARAFNYGGFKGREIYDPRQGLSDPPNVANSRNSASTVHHFYDKLLILKDLMNTPTGRKLAEVRHNFMVGYLDQFFSEWNTS